MLDIIRSPTTSYTIDKYKLCLHHSVRILLIGEDVIKLTPIEYKLILALLEKRIVEDTTLAQYTGNQDISIVGVRESLEKHIVNLRSKLRPCNLNIYRIRSYGYILAEKTAQ